MEIYHQYIKLRKQFGRWPKFADEGSEMLADIRPNEDHGKEYIPRNPVTTVTQCVPEMSEHDANTNAVILVNKAMSHVEGGWPKDVDYTEAEHTIRYRKKVRLDGCRRYSCRLGSQAYPAWGFWAMARCAPRDWVSGQCEGARRLRTIVVLHGN